LVGAEGESFALRLRTRLVALVCLAALPPLGIQAWTDWRLVNEQRARLESQLETEARLLAGELAATLEAGAQLLTALSASPAVRVPGTDRCAPLLADLATGFTAFRVLAVADQTGVVVCASRQLPWPPPNVADRGWFRKVFENNAPAIGTPGPGALLADPQLPLAWPVRLANQRPFRVVVAGLDLNAASARIAAQAQPDRTVIVADPESGRVVAAANAPGVAPGARLTAPVLPQGEDSRSVALSRDGGRIAATMLAPSTMGALAVTVAAPADAVLAPIRETSIRASIVLGLVALLSLVVALLGARLFLERPLARLAAAMRDWRAGVYQARAQLRGSGEVADLGQTFDTMAEAVESRDAALKRAAENKARLLAAAAHDQRHRLQVLQMLVDHAAGAPPEAGFDQRILVAADASVRDLERSISQLLSASALESGAGPKPQPRTVPARLLLDQAAQSVRLKAEGKGLRVKVHATRALVRTDPAMMATVLLNLAENAVKYSDRGGILFGVRQGPGGSVRLAVYDTGLGIPRTERGRIFEEFNRLNPKREGLGLGLSIVRRLCDRLGHQVAVESVEGRGSAFLIEVPRG
jgi:signal transduction histidine kinase